MHFQTPPDDHAKIVYCTSGSLIDVVVDIRKNSTTYGQFITVELSGNNAKGVYLPTGTAHGFYVRRRQHLHGIFNEYSAQPNK